VVKSYNTEDFENHRYAATNRYLLKSTMRALRIGLMVGPTVETVGIILICFFLMWCFATDVKISDVVPMLAPLLIIYKPVKQLSKLQVQIDTSMAALSRIYSVLDLNMELPERADAKRKDSFDRGIVFDNVSFTYDTAESEAVKDVSFELPCGKMVAVVGGTGSGKSTTAGLLARFFDPQKGSIIMDGVDIRDLRTHDLREQLSLVGQQALLFAGTIRENIRLGRLNATDEEIMAAADSAAVTKFLASQPAGIDTKLAQGGEGLSGGQRQRVAIARAFVKDAPILILDEATASLDAESEREIQEELDKLAQGRTTLIVAHRFSTIRNAHRILVFERGYIVGDGTHEELYASCPLYKELYDRQGIES
jgi:subfamily B ATP-binding cassette protein MsbA